MKDNNSFNYRIRLPVRSSRFFQWTMQWLKHFGFCFFPTVNR